MELPWSLDCRDWAGVVEGVEATYCRGTHHYPHNCTGEHTAWLRGDNTRRGSKGEGRVSRREERTLTPHCTTGDRVTVRQQVWREEVTVAGLEGGKQYTVWLRLQYRSGPSGWAEGVTVTTTASPQGKLRRARVGVTW